MIVIACVDNNMGMLFNQRRQSRIGCCVRKSCSVVKVKSFG